MTELLEPPRRPRDLFELLSGLDDSGDAQELLSKVNWKGVKPRQVYQGVLGRLPEDAKFAVPADDYDAQGHALSALMSGEFRSEIRERLLAAYPEKRRIMFIHVPKCAGTDLIENLGAHYPRLPEDLSRPEWSSTSEFLLFLREFATQARKSQSIFIHGHVPLNWYLDRQLRRFDDIIFTVVREPIAIAISQVNYIFKRFFEAPRCHHPDTREWADYLGIETFDRNMPPRALRELGMRALKDTRIVTPNTICSFLGDGTAASALDALGRSDVEVTDVKRYEAWLREVWNLAATRANASRPVITLDQIDEADRKYLEEISIEDVKLYRAISKYLDTHGVNSVFGTDLAKEARL